MSIITEELLLKYQRARVLDFKIRLKYPITHLPPGPIFDEILWMLKMPKMDAYDIERFYDYTIAHQDQLVIDE